MDGRVLCVDSDETVRGRTADALRDAGLAVEECPTVEAALATAEGVACVVTEYQLPDGTGLDLLDRLPEVAPDAACVLFTDAPLDALDTGGDGPLVEYIPRGGPSALDRLTGVVERAVGGPDGTEYPLPADEAARLAALERYAPDPVALGESFDRLTELAADLLGVPTAGIGLLDVDSQEFVACRGVQFGSVPREETVCTYAILEESVTTITDVETDDRFPATRALADRGLRAYASANLTVDGQVVGTLCVYDDAVREWSDRDSERLELLAAEVAEQLELRRRARAATVDADGGGVPEGSADAGSD